MFHIARNTFGRIVSFRKIHTTQSLCIDPKTVEEIRIPVPWGYIAGKWWGKKDIQPIVAIHGWQDNAGTWDPLAELMPDNYSLLAIDIPGNGFSSHLPTFQNYHFFDSVSVLRRIKKYYDFGSLSLLGHSGGSAMCFLYSAIFPEDVTTFFGLDYILYAYKSEGKRVARSGKLLDKVIGLASRDLLKGRAYTRDEAIATWVAGTKGSVSEKSAGILLKRGAIRLENGKVMFSRDNRLKSPDFVLINVDQAYTLAKNVNCDICIVKAGKSKLFDSGMKYCPDILDVVKENAKSFTFHEVDANHHLHMDVPETVVELYLNFIKKVSSRSQNSELPEKKVSSS